MDFDIGFAKILFFLFETKGKNLFFRIKISINIFGLLCANIETLILKYKKMKKRILSAAAFLFVAVAMNAQTAKQEVKKDAKAVGTAVEKGAKATGEGVRDGAEWVGDKATKGAKATKTGVKKGAKWTGKTAKKGAKAVEKTAVKGADAVSDGYKDVKADLKK